MKKQRGTKADEKFMKMDRETARAIRNQSSPAKKTKKKTAKK